MSMCNVDSECGYIPHPCVNVEYISEYDLKKYNTLDSNEKNYCECIKNKCKLLENLE